MEIIITVKEIKPGQLHTEVQASAQVTALEARMVKHLAGHISRGLDGFDQQPDITGFGTGLRIIDREIKK